MMDIRGLNKLTLTDYPGKTAAIVFTGGCNFKCPFCHNPSLVLNEEEIIPQEEVLIFLEKRKKILDGVVISGGEPLMNRNIEDFILKARALGYCIKLDTNGSYPQNLISLIEKGLIDYVAMDIKNTFEDYDVACGIKTDTEKIWSSAKYLMSSHIEHEFRTTLIKEFHTKDKLKSLMKEFSGQRYFLQDFNDSVTLSGGLHGFTKEETKELFEYLVQFNPALMLRN